MKSAHTKLPSIGTQLILPGQCALLQTLHWLAALALNQPNTDLYIS